MPIIWRLTLLLNLMESWKYSRINFVLSPSLIAVIFNRASIAFLQNCFPCFIIKQRIKGSGVPNKFIFSVIISVTTYWYYVVLMKMKCLLFYVFNSVNKFDMIDIRRSPTMASNIRNCRSSHRRCSLRKGILRNFAKFIGKHLFQSLFLIKLQAWALLSAQVFNHLEF